MTASGPSVPRPEIVAPAGDVRALAAAVKAGADAVYFGLSQFNARNRAANFSLPEAFRAIAALRGLGVKSCLALNTVVTENELPEMERLLCAIRRCPPDAVIFQDLAVMELVHRLLPGVELHASTQTGTHSLDGLRFFARFGVKRAVLARELSYGEIRSIAASSPLETEVFVFGAMCASVSGYCYASLLSTGRSGNRGLCAQICRAAGNRRAPFSMKDLDLTRHYRDLARAGVRAFKIEGRMKGADYVFETVKAFAILREAGGAPEAVREVHERLQRLLLRETGPGYWNFPAVDLYARVKGHLHEDVGRVAYARGNRLVLEGEPFVRLSPGARLKVGGKGATVTDVRGAEITLAVPLEARPGQMASLFPNANTVPGLDGVLANIMKARVPLRCRVDVQIQAGRLRAQARAAGPAASSGKEEAAPVFWEVDAATDTGEASQHGLTAEFLANRLSSPSCSVVSCTVNENSVLLRHGFLKRLRDELAGAADAYVPAVGASVLGEYPPFAWDFPPEGALSLPPVEYVDAGAELLGTRVASVPDIPLLVNHYGQVERFGGAGVTLFSGPFLPVLNRVAAHVLRRAGVSGFVEPYESNPDRGAPYFVLRRLPARLPTGFRQEALPGGAFLVYGPSPGVL